MPLNISVTKRELKNKTGINISVGSYDSAPTPKQVKNYHVVVITRLPFFKRPEHSEEDVVQFMVRRDYSAFEQLQRDILLAFPELKLPSLPRKFHVFMSESDVDERMVSFDCVIKVISRRKEMCCSPPMLEFLGFNILSDKEYFKARRKYLQKQQEETEAQERKNQFVFGDHLEKEGFFGEESSEDIFSDDPPKRTEPFTVDSIFEDSSGGSNKAAKKSAKISVLEEEDVMVDGKRLESSNGNNTNKSSLLDELEDNSELLNVSDTLDDVLKIAESKKSRAKKVSSLSSSLEPSKTTDLFSMDEDDLVGSSDVADMGTDDIMKYIQTNQTTDDDSLDLF